MPSKKIVRKSAPKPMPRKAVKKDARTEIPAAGAPIKINRVKTPWFSMERMTIYTYWFIILFFVGATFYILGRGQEFFSKPQNANNVEVVDVSAPVQAAANDYLTSGKGKLLSGDASGAIYDLSAAIKANPHSAEALVFRGEAFMQTGDAASAMADFNRAIELSPVSAVAYYDRAILSARAEDYPSAFADINNALSAFEQSQSNNILSLSDIYSKRAQFNLWAKNWDAAVADYTAAIANGSDNPANFAGRAEANTALGNYAPATEDYLSAIRLISEQITSAHSVAERETMSRNAMAYFEKSAALRVQLKDLEGARTDLQSATTIANALGDKEQVDRLQALAQGIQ
ncbi:MAG: tetratricopeptide repeat protein [Proteobacteria bacterium]|nr:tetratricopeptide repeat protein [Pseudomonadota bacterium]